MSKWKTICGSPNILRCADNSFYIGHTDNLKERISKHNSGKAAKWTACRLPVKLIYIEQYQTIEESMRRELQIKKWSRAKKEALATGNAEKLKVLAKCRER
jgi:predicted GIY-YIG superfamily endonuclease